MEKQQYEILMNILNGAKDTDYGRRYSFDNIKTIDAFQNVLPITDYDNYASFFELMTRLGEREIITALPLVCYTLTSGTMGAPRIIPCTTAHLQYYIDEFRKIRTKGSIFALVQSFPKGKAFEDGAYLNSIFGAVLTACRKKIKDNSHARIFVANSLTSPTELIFPTELFDQCHARILFALLDKNVEQIFSPFTWEMLETFEYLEKNWKMLVRDIEKGAIDDSVTLSDEIRAKLNTKLRGNPKRAAELRTIFEQGFDQPIAPKVWPNLTRVTVSGTGDYRIYTEKLDPYIGDIPMNFGYYAYPEALLAKSIGDCSEEYIMLPETGFYEFLPINSQIEEQIRPLTMNNLETEKMYEVLVTNNAGLYRYRLGDVIKVKRYEDEVPVISYEYRLNETSSLAEDKIIEYI